MIEPLTYKEQNREYSLKAVKAMRHVMIVMNEVYRDFWNRDPQLIVDSLNEDVDLAIERFYSNTTLGNVLNDRADAAKIAERVCVTMPEGYKFDDNTRLFSYATPIVIVQTEEPEDLIEGTSV
jgi:hypothetical protein